MVWFGFMVFNATFNNISVISWQSVLLVEKTGGPGENHRLVASHYKTFIRIMLYQVHLDMNEHLCNTCLIKIFVQKVLN
jgi:hypothetical protein